MTRLPDWRVRLNAVVDEAMTKEFAWGSHDCAFGLAAPSVRALTGEPIAEEWVGTYSTALGALKRLKEEGYESVVDYVAKRFEEIHTSLARVGDLAAIKTEETGWALGVFMGERIGVVTPAGYGTIERGLAQRAFKVG